MADRGKKKKKKKTVAGRIQNIILFLAIICFLGSAGYLIKYYWDGYQAEKTVEDLRGLIDDNTVVSEAAPGEAAEDDMSKVFARLYALNNDFVGWLSIEGTNIDYPVVHTPDDPEFYLRRNFHGEAETAGTLFVDYRSTLNPASANVIIYGHNMKNKTMFYELLNYQDKSFYEEHKNITFDTLYGRGEYEIVAVIKSKAYGINEDVFKYYDFIDANTEEEFDEIMQNIRRLQLYDTGVESRFGDRLITLSTCEYSQTDGRFAVIARKTNVN